MLKASRTKTPAYTQTVTAATGLGTLEKSRGAAHVYDSATGTARGIGP